MHAFQIYYCVLAVVLVTSTCAAPLQEKAKEKKDVKEATLVEKVPEEEAELEKLVSLAGEEAKGNNVAVHESEVTHYENKNGEEIKVQETEQKVTDTETGKVLADVKQVAEQGEGEDGQPQTVAQTEVDIPDKNIHETFVQDDSQEDSSEEDVQDRAASIQYSPRAVAEHLLLSNDFNNFYTALKELVNSNIMTEEEAGEYEAQVVAEYQRLLGEQPQAFPDMADEEVFPTYDLNKDKRSGLGPMIDDLPRDLYNLDPAYDSYVQNDLGLGSEGLVEESEEDSLSDIIDTLLNAWWEKDFEGGNVRAQALVNYLYDVVSRDSNPDDIGQIRSILADILANSLLEDVENAENEYKMERALEAEEPSQEVLPVQAPEASSEETAAQAEPSKAEETQHEAEEELQQLSKAEEQMQPAVVEQSPSLAKETPTVPDKKDKEETKH